MAGPHDDDPYYCVALVFTVFMCSRCNECLIGDDHTGESYGPGDDWYHRFSEFARRAGWHAENYTTPNGSQDWFVLCPACAAKQWASKLGAVPDVSDTPPKHWGAVGVGRTSRFDVEIDVSFDDANDLQMSIRTQRWTFRFALLARADVARMLSFLRENTGRLVFSEIVVGTFHNARVWLIKDDEFADRFWLRARGNDLMVEFVLAANDVAEFTDAVAQAVDDLQH